MDGFYTKAGIADIVETNKRRLNGFLSDYGLIAYPLFSQLISRLETETDFFYGPSSTKWHSAYPGGGFDHVMGVTEWLAGLTDKNVCNYWQRNCGNPFVSPIIVGLLHDATKFNVYHMTQATDEQTGKAAYEYQWDGSQCRSKIHGEDSLLRAMEFLPLTEEEQFCIRWHMGAYETDNWNGYDAAIKKYPNVLWTHTADMYASKVIESRKGAAHA